MRVIARANWHYLVLAGWVLALGLGVIPLLFHPAPSDEAGFLYLAGQVLDGKRHGVDFFDLNPPLAIWLSIPAVAVQRGLGGSPWVIWIVMVVGVILGSTFLLAKLLRSLESSVARRTGLLLAAACSTLLFPGLDFSEREHLALVLVLPFIALAALRVSRAEVGRSDALTAGLMGGFGFSLKPHFLLGWVLLELWLLGRLRGRSLRREELWALVGVGASYVALVLLLTPDYLPMATRLAPHYHAYLHNPIGTVLLMAGPVLLFTVGVGLAARAGGSRDDPLRDALSLAFLGFLLAAVLQQKGLSYHYLAAAGTGFLLLTRAWQTRPPRLGWYPSAIILRIGFVLLLAIPILKVRSLAAELLRPREIRFGADPLYPQLLTTVRRLAAGAPVLSFSSNMNDGWPLTLDAGSRWASRYMHFWPMAAAYHAEILARPTDVVRARPFAARSGFERQFSREVVEDLRQHEPLVLIVVLPDSTEIFGGHARRFDYLEYFYSDPDFQRIMRSYREVPGIGIYRIFVRTPGARESASGPQLPPAQPPAVTGRN